MNVFEKLIYLVAILLGFAWGVLTPLLGTKEAQAGMADLLLGRNVVVAAILATVGPVQARSEAEARERPEPNGQPRSSAARVTSQP